MPAAFHPYGASHQVALAATAVVLVLMLALARTRLARVAERLLGALLLAVVPGAVIVHWVYGSLYAQTCLPLQYCDVAAIAGGLGLCFKKSFWCEVVYFFGLAGTFQGLLTPALQFDQPDPRYYAFFLLHGGVTVAAFYVVTGMRLRPAPGAVRRVMTFSLAWYAVTALVNLALGTNYAFQCAKPAGTSLFDWLGPWPWYNFSAIGVGLVLYLLLALPFALRQRKG